MEKIYNLKEMGRTGWNTIATGTMTELQKYFFYHGFPAHMALGEHMVGRNGKLYKLVQQRKRREIVK